MSSTGIKNPISNGTTSSALNGPLKDVEYYYMPTTEDRIRKGDIVLYDGHVAVVYSERADSSNSTGLKYKIIHAFGSTPYKITDEVSGEKEGVSEFSRKVTVTGEDIIGKKNKHKYKGFGRIKLWN